MGYKKYLLIALGLFMLLYPSYFFGTLGVIVLVIILLLFVIDIVVDIYLVIAFFIQRRKDK